MSPTVIPLIQKQVYASVPECCNLLLTKLYHTYFCDYSILWSNKARIDKLSLISVQTINSNTFSFFERVHLCIIYLFAKFRMQFYITYQMLQRMLMFRFIIILLVSQKASKVPFFASPDQLYTVLYIGTTELICEIVLVNVLPT